MAFISDSITQAPFTVGGVLIIGLAIFYVFYQRFLHPLANYPGPFIASITDLWQVGQFLSLQQPYHLTDLHLRYGPIVRYGPDKLSITHEGAIPLIYQTSARLMPKTEFYDAYGAGHPNVFGMRDESLHATRRRHMSHSFSMSYIKDMEQYLDKNIQVLKDKIKLHALKDEAFDLKKALHYYTIDVLLELAFSQPFGAQSTNDASRVPPVIEHSFLAAVTGAWPLMTMTLKKWLPYVPHAGLQKLFAGRKACADLASVSVDRRLSDLSHPISSQPERKDILTNLIKAKDPENGENLTPIDLKTEAFGFIIAGTHTTSSTASLLFYHLLHNPEFLKQCTEEIDSKLPPLNPDEAAYPIATVEASLPFLRNCIRENFRVTPVFTMPLARRVLNPAGITIEGSHIPYGTSVAVCNHAFHHNPVVWGEDHTVFNPHRWNDPSIAAKARLLMHFGLGSRQCIGKTVATTNIYKLLSTLLKEFEFELKSEQERADVDQGLYKGRIPEMFSVGISDLKEPLLVKARVR